MLEEDTRTRLCPFKMNREALTGTSHCDGPACMAWEVWQDPIRDELDIITGYKPKVPAQGHCGMILVSAAHLSELGEQSTARKPAQSKEGPADDG